MVVHFHIYHDCYIYRHLAGAELSMLGMQELKQLERQLKTGIERIRSKMVYRLLNIITKKKTMTNLVMH